MVGNRKRRLVFFTGLVGALLNLGSCSEEKSGSRKVESHALAVVGDQEIDEADLREFEATIQSTHRSNKSGFEAHREHLHSLIDAKLMVLEAEKRGLHEDQELVEGLERVKHPAMINAYLRFTVGQNITITEEELRENFNTNPARNEVRGARILLATREEADEVCAAVVAGRSFEELARERSLDRETAEKGGAFDRYYTYDQVSGQVFAKVFEKEVGELLEPFRTQHGWEVVKVIDKKPVDFEKYRPIIQYATMMKKFDKLKKEHIISLQEKRNLRINNNELELFLQAWNQASGRPDIAPERLGAPLFLFDGGEITLKQTINVLVNTGLGQTRLDMDQVEQRIRDVGAADLLLYAAAEEGGFADHPEVLEKVAKEREKRLLEALWEEELEEGVQVNEEEAREHFEDHPEFYKAPEEIVVQEILVATRARAEELLKQIGEGADIGELASRYSIRLYANQNAGLYGIRAFERIIYKELMEAAENAPVGAVQGPVRISKPLISTLATREKLDEAYSLFKVLERLPERVKSFEESRRLASFYARQTKQLNRLRDLNEELRRKYSNRWGINEMALKSYAEALVEN